MILVDTNIIMYAAGKEHPNKAPAADLIDQVAMGGINALIDAETLQEILHRYQSLGRWPEGREIFGLARAIFRDILPITAEVMDRAQRLIESDHTLKARDAVHAAVVFQYGLDGIMSFDRDFDRIQGIRRQEPPRS
jgi:uncharacterized protein